ncbi:MAG: NAD(P)H-dependent oxidoreductase [Pseudomonadota bacterium]
MTRILRIDASARHENSVSRGLADRLIARLEGEVTTRDVGGDPLPHVTGTWAAATFTPPAERTDDHKAALALSDDLVAEIQAADILVISTPIYNFGVPAALKAWADQVARVGVTFEYTENGPKGLLEGKRAIVAVSSGGTKVGSDIDFATPWLLFFLGFIGIEDVEIVAADALMGDPDAVTRAEAEIDAIAA